MGTTGYMSPEQALGENIDERSDIFSLGVVLYEMVAGQPPFKGKTDSHTRVSIIDHEPVPLVQHVSTIPRQFERIVLKALAKDRLKRYQTITDLKIDLEQLRDELHISDTSESTRQEVRTTQADLLSSGPTAARSQVTTVAESTTASSSSGIDYKPADRRRKWLAYAAGVLVLLVIVVGVIMFASSPASDKLSRHSSIRKRQQGSGRGVFV